MPLIRRRPTRYLHPNLHPASPDPAQRRDAPHAGRPTLHPDLLRGLVRILDCRDFADELATLPEWVLTEFGTSRAALLAFADRLGRDALSRARAEAASDALAAVRLPALIFDARGEIVAANALIAPLNSFVQCRLGDGVALTDRAADVLLGEAIAAMGADAPFTARAFPARAADDPDALMVVHVLPIRAATHDPLLRRAILALAPARPAPAPPEQLVQALLDLTRAEARVACALAAGKTVEEIAIESGSAQATIRTHLHRVLEKTGCARQAEIVALLAGISSTRLIGPRAE